MSCDVVLGDSGFESYWAIAELVERGVDAVFELNATRKVPGRASSVRLRRPAPSKRPDWMTLAEYHRVPETLALRRLLGTPRARARLECDRYEKG